MQEIMYATTDSITIGVYVRRASVLNSRPSLSIGCASLTDAADRVGGFLPEGMSRTSRGKDPCSESHINKTALRSDAFQFARP